MKALVLCLFVLSEAIFAQAPTWNWVKKLNHPYTTIQADQNGNVYAAGPESSTAAMLYMAKFDLQGNLLWEIPVAEPEPGTIPAKFSPHLVTTPAGISYVAIQYQGALMIAGTNSVITPTANKSQYDILLVKINADGTIAWARNLGNIYENHLTGLALTPSHELLIYGGYYGTFTLDSYTLTSNSWGMQQFTALFDASGNVKWANQLYKGQSEPPYWNIPIAMIAHSDGSIYQFYKPSYKELNIVKHNSSGQLQWDKIFPYDQCLPLSVQTTANSLLVGSFSEIMQVDTAGAITTSKQISTLCGPVSVNSLNELNNHIYFTGAFSQTLTLDGSSLLNTYSTQGNHGPVPGRGFYVADYDLTSSSVKWLKGVDGVTNSGGNAVATAPNAGLFVAGGAQDTIQFDNQKMGSSGWWWFLGRLNASSPVAVQEQLSPGRDWDIYPNPTDGVVSIRRTELTNSFAVIVFDNAGRVVLQKNYYTADPEVEMNVSTLAPGFYVCTVICDQQQTSRKLMIR